ncbi:DUF2914 domain-containing protein [Hydrogenovibrio kuenenii]|uniref:DUF2914 domain-containing protein n=1 Tax=Hydrogenovibrio kuenenii TaxID=63658 RepID=UPI0012FEF9D8|nr:DUF2914 domain-containing protein [Hydrogenovibrio kuenenii]
MSQIPSQIKLDGTMREYFQEGWHQYQDDLAEASESDTDSPWRNKVVWSLMGIFAGLATASLMIHNIQKEKQTSHRQASETVQNIDTKPSNISTKATQTQPDDFSLITTNQTPNQATHSNTKSTSTSTTQENSKTKSNKLNKPTSQSDTLSLLSSNERQDLSLAKQAFDKPLSKSILTPLVNTSIHISRAKLTNTIIDKEPGSLFAETVPKYVRKIYFFSQIQNAKGQTLYHRWLYNGQIMATIPLTVRSNNFRTWSSKRLSSAWSGDWAVEILNSQKQPIFRLNFKYAQ